MVTKEWKRAKIPLSAFASKGIFWDGSAEQTLDFDWDDVREFKISTAPIRGGQQTVLYFTDIKVAAPAAELVSQ